jgi:hypothetical protein
VNRPHYVGFIVLGLALVVSSLAAQEQINTVVGGGPNGIPGLATNITISDGFKEVDNCVHRELGAGQACEVHVRFDPESAGAVTGTLRVNSNALLTADGSGTYNGNPDTVTLNGNGIN